MIGSLVWLRNRISSGLITADIAASDHRPIISVSPTSVDESPASVRRNFHRSFRLAIFRRVRARRGGRAIFPATQTLQAAFSPAPSPLDHESAACWIHSHGRVVRQLARPGPTTPYKLTRNNRSSRGGPSAASLISASRNSPSTRQRYRDRCFARVKMIGRVAEISNSVRYIKLTDARSLMSICLGAG